MQHASGPRTDDDAHVDTAPGPDTADAHAQPAPRRDAADGYASPAPTPDLAAAQRRTVATLTVSQVLGSVGVGTGFAVSALVATSLSSSPAQAGLLQGISGTGTIAATLVLARVSASRGRRPGLALGYLVAAVGAAAAAVGIVQESYALFLVGGALFSVANATNLQARFAAGDLAAPGSRAAGMSLVLWMSTVGSVVGPNLATWGGELTRRHGLDPWAGAYLAAALGFLLAGGVVALRLRPDPLVLARAVWASTATAAEQARDRTLRAGAVAVLGSAGARFAVASMVAAHATMIGVMSWTPVHMAGLTPALGHAGHHGVSSQAVIGYVLSGHLAGMYALSPVVGWAARRFGDTRVLLTGLAVQGVAVGLSATLPPSAGLGLGLGLVGLGIGWSAVFLASSSLLTSSVGVERRAAAQGVTDSAVWAASVLSVMVSGWVLGTFGFAVLARGTLLLLLPAAVWGVVRLARPRQGGR